MKKAWRKNTRSCLYIAIDPGFEGAVAAVDDQSYLGAWDTPTVKVRTGKRTRSKYEPYHMADLLRRIISKHPSETVQIGLELVHAMPKQGVTSMFSMGHGLGVWEGLIAGLGLPLFYVPPQTWKRVIFAGEGVGQDKEASRLMAMRRYPAAAADLARKRDHGRADAILIAHYLRRQNRTACAVA